MRFGLVFGQTYPCHFRVCIGNTWNDARIECGSGEFFVTLQFASDYFSRHVRFVHRFVRQHGLTHDIANRKNMRHVGAHLDIYVDKATVRHRHAGFFCGNFFTVGCATYGLQDQVVDLWCWSGAALFSGRERHFNAFGRSFRTHGFGFQHDIVKAVGIHFLPDFDQIAVSALHQTVHHFYDIQSRA